MKHDEEWQQENLVRCVGMSAKTMVDASDYAEAYAEHMLPNMNAANNALADTINDKNKRIADLEGRVAELEWRLGLPSSNAKETT